jgi:hypothetical protein
MYRIYNENLLPFGVDLGTHAVNLGHIINLRQDASMKRSIEIGELQGRATPNNHLN